MSQPQKLKTKKTKRHLIRHRRCARRRQSRTDDFGNGPEARPRHRQSFARIPSRRSDGTRATAARLPARMDENGKHRYKILIGKDTRLSGYMLETALASGIVSMGADVLLVGPLPTPGVAFLTRSMRADAGVVISASHNPYQDNGIKFFSWDGFKLPDEVEARMEELIITGETEESRPTASEIGKAYRISDAVGRYNVFLKNSFPRHLTLEGSQDRRRLRPWRGIQSRAGSFIRARRRRVADRRATRRRKYQSALRRALSGIRSRCSASRRRRFRGVPGWRRRSGDFYRRNR